MRSVATGEDVAQLGEDPGGTGVRRVYVEPEPLSLANVGDRRNRIDRGRGRRAYGCDHGQRKYSRPAISFHCRRQCPGVHAESIICRNLPESAQPEAERHHRLVDARVRFFRAIDGNAGQIRSAGHSIFAEPEPGM